MSHCRCFCALGGVGWVLVWRCCDGAATELGLQSYRKLVATPKYGRALRTLDGIRVISMLWLIMGQTLLIQMPLLDSSRFILAQLRARPSFQVVLNASLATDTFLLVSGMLAMYKMLQRFSRRSTPRGVVNVTFSIIAVMLKRVRRSRHHFWAHFSWGFQLHAAPSHTPPSHTPPSHTPRSHAPPSHTPRDALYLMPVRIRS